MKELEYFKSKLNKIIEKEPNIFGSYMISMESKFAKRLQMELYNTPSNQQSKLDKIEEQVDKALCYINPENWYEGLKDIQQILKEETMNKNILVNRNFLHDKLEEMINIAKKDSTSKIAIGQMECVRNNIRHVSRDTTELLEDIKYKQNELKEIGSIKELLPLLDKLYKALGGTNER